MASSRKLGACAVTAQSLREAKVSTGLGGETERGARRDSRAGCLRRCCGLEALGAAATVVVDTHKVEGIRRAALHRAAKAGPAH